MMNKTVLYGTIGSSLEWYDFTIFGLLAPTLATIFFPQQSSSAALIMNYGIFYLGFILRPVGGVWLGHIADKYGRKKAILLSMVLMTIATVGIGCIPVGKNELITALLLLILRLLQGVSTGGEYPSVLTLAGELSNQQTFFQHLGVSVSGVKMGGLLGSIVGFIFLSINNIHAWRLPFLIAVFLGIFGVYFRLKAVESPSFIQLKQQHSLSSLQYFRRSSNI